MKVKHVSAFACLTLALQVPVFAGGSTTTTANGPTPAPTTATGGDWYSQWGLGIQAGTQGVGLHVRYDLNPSLYFKLEGNYVGFKDSYDIDDITFDGDLDFSNIGLTANYLPFAGHGFRLSAGAYFGQNEFTGTVSGGGTVDLNGTTYLLGARSSVTGKVDCDTFNPYLGIGWDWALGEEKNYIISLDAGVSYLGKPTTSLTASGPVTLTPGFQADLAAQQNSFQDAADKIEFYPVLKLSFTYRF